LGSGFEACALPVFGVFFFFLENFAVFEISKTTYILRIIVIKAPYTISYCWSLCLHDNSYQPSGP